MNKRLWIIILSFLSLPAIGGAVGGVIGASAGLGAALCVMVLAAWLVRTPQNYQAVVVSGLNGKVCCTHQAGIHLVCWPLEYVATWIDTTVKETHETIHVVQSLDGLPFQFDCRVLYAWNVADMANAEMTRLLPDLISRRISLLNFQLSENLRDLAGRQTARQLCLATTYPRLTASLTRRLQQKLCSNGLHVKQLIIEGAHPPAAYLKTLVSSHGREVEVSGDVGAMCEIQRAIHPWDPGDRQMVTDLESLRRSQVVLVRSNGRTNGLHEEVWRE